MATTQLRREPYPSPAHTAQSELTVSSLSPQDELAWEAYVHHHPHATLFHTLKWKRAIEKTFNYDSQYLVAKANAEIRGILPLFVVSNWITGRALISSPFAVYGGICASDLAAEKSLVKRAYELARKQDVEYLELRQRYELSDPRLAAKDLYVLFDQDLPRDPEELFNGLPRNTRYMIRKARQAGLTVSVGSDHLDLFYEMYALSLRRLGTPVFPRVFFQNLKEEFGPTLQVHIVTHGRTALATVLVFRFRDWLVPYYMGYVPEARRLGANYFIFWEMMRESCQAGIRHFDFGRSKLGTGARFFKTRWNMQEHMLRYQYYLVNRKTLPNYSPANARFKLASAIWRHLPLRLTNAVGPALVRWFP